MTLDEVITFFRVLADEPDLTFLPQADLIPLVKSAYYQYHRAITNISDSPFMTTLDIAAPTQEIDLTVAPNNLLGVTPWAGNKRMARLDAVSTIALSGANTSYLFSYIPAGSITEFHVARRQSYILVDKKLKFNTAQAAGLGTLRLTYTYFPDIDFTKVNPGDNQEIDEFAEFHDIIALLLYKLYAIKDVAVNIPMENQLAARMADLKAYFEQGQSFGANQYVSRTYRR